MQDCGKIIPLLLQLITSSFMAVNNRYDLRHFAMRRFYRFYNFTY